MKNNNEFITEENGGFVARDPDTGVTSQGTTNAEAVTNLQEAVALYLQEEKREIMITASNSVGIDF